MQIVVTQCPEYGFLCGPKHTSLSIRINNAIYDISIDQIGKRTISIETTNGDYQGLLSVYYTLDTLLMLFEGQFYTVVQANDSADITISMQHNKLPSFTSADFMVEFAARLIDYSTVLNDEVFEKWYILSEKLDLVHKMVLYCLSAVEIPKDIQCAYMVEAFEGLCRLVHEQKSDFELPLNNYNRLELRLAFTAVAENYGSDIFAEEFNRNKEQFVGILIDSRNRIAHLNTGKAKKYLNGEECVRYMQKLSLLYRVVLFDLLGIPQSCYDQTLKTYIQKANEYSAIQNFLKTLQKKKQTNNPNEKKIEAEIMSILYDFTYSLAIHKTLYSRASKIRKLPKEQVDFWFALSDKCLLMSIADWCKVFGAKSERTHYSKIHESLNKRFIQELEKQNIDFTSFSNQMKNIRDTFVSHRDDIKRRKRIPKPETALYICNLYDRLVIGSQPFFLPFEFDVLYQNTVYEVSRYLDYILDYSIKEGELNNG